MAEGWAGAATGQSRRGCSLGRRVEEREAGVGDWGEGVGGWGWEGVGSGGEGRAMMAVMEAGGCKTSTSQVHREAAC